jgi:hypothetical protein
LLIERPEKKTQNGSELGLTEKFVAGDTVIIKNLETGQNISIYYHQPATPDPRLLHSECSEYTTQISQYTVVGYFSLQYTPNTTESGTVQITYTGSNALPHDEVVIAGHRTQFPDGNISSVATGEWPAAAASGENNTVTAGDTITFDAKSNYSIKIYREIDGEWERNLARDTGPAYGSNSSQTATPTNATATTATAQQLSPPMIGLFPTQRDRSLVRASLITRSQ